MMPLSASTYRRTKAVAVVEAMEREMGTTLATRQDLEQLRWRSSKQDLEILRREIENSFRLVEPRIIEP